MESSEVTSSIPVNSTKQGAWAGVLRAVPIVLGYIPVGFAYGVLAQKAGLSGVNTILMSILVYAGSSQLIAVGLFAAQVSVISIILTTFIVNLRHFLMASAIAPYLKGWRKIELAAFAYELTDESFAIHSMRFPSGVPRKSEVFATNITPQVAWVTGTILGLFAGKLMADVKPFALDYALPAMFIVLIVLQIKYTVQVVVAVFTGILSILLIQTGMTQWNVIAATVAGATVGVVIERWNRPQSS